MYTLSQVHIDMARNSTDDFNLFHDQFRWGWIKGNPFKGPIALGFQLGCMVETHIPQNSAHLTVDMLRFSSFEFNFANAVKVGDEVSVELKKSRLSKNDSGKQYSTRVCLKTNNKPAIIGFKRDGEYPTLNMEFPEVLLSELKNTPDRSFILDGEYFFKRKWMIVGNAKNFLLSAFADQTKFIDEFANKVTFPQMYPLALLSSAMLERAQAIRYDLVKNPLIYTAQHLCVDKVQLKQLRSNDALNILIREPLVLKTGAQRYECFGYVNQQTPLFTAQVDLMQTTQLPGK
ncbi:hypothetical protein ACFO4O_00130 [Glaciecola siphonariae]|uniref:Acyl dehydratase n=1 Tax=Glaciecola siphonariae TaxID=521012 RepID=A0ABV9LQH5_9ALTE